jgi:serine phosphatase RsbU (regulator of sigma subunit)
MFDYSRVKIHFNEIIDTSPNGIIKNLVEAGDNWMNGRVQDDDITFVVIKVK